MKDYQGKHVFSGTHGELWADNEYLAEVVAFEAKLNLDFADVNKARSLAKHTKLMGYEGEGTMKLNKVSSHFIKLVSDNLKEGKQTEVKLISNIDDPDAKGNERIVIYDATINEIALANWESKNLVEEEIPFFYTDWDIEDFA